MSGSPRRLVRRVVDAEDQDLKILYFVDLNYEKRYLGDSLQVVVQVNPDWSHLYLI